MIKKIVRLFLSVVIAFTCFSCVNTSIQSQESKEPVAFEGDLQAWSLYLESLFNANGYKKTEKWYEVKIVKDITDAVDGGLISKEKSIYEGSIFLSEQENGIKFF